METKRIKRQVVMLPTEKASRLFLSDDKETTSTTPISVKSPNSQYIYITSNEDIKNGDYYLIGDKIKRADINEMNFSLENLNSIKHTSVPEKYHPKKIIITTDVSLTTDEPITGKDISYGFATYIKEKDAYYKCLTQPSPQFVESFAKFYNDKNPIKEVMVDYEIVIGDIQLAGQDRWIGGLYEERLKVDKNNYATITKAKDGLKELCAKDEELKKELKELCWQAYISSIGEDGKIRPSEAEKALEPFNKWFNDSIQ